MCMLMNVVVSTDALYFMFIEACFALCTICLPTLSTGALKLKGVQNLVAGFSLIFSFSQRSLDTLPTPADKHEILGSGHSGFRHSPSGSVTENAREIEMQTGRGIKVTKSFEYTRSMA